MTIEPYFMDITCTHRIKSMIRISAILSQFLFVMLWIFVLSLSLRRQMGVLVYILKKNHEGITPLFLHKVSKHYNALSPLDIKYLWHPGRAHNTDSCADDVIPFSKSGTCADDNVSATLYDDETSPEDFLYHMQKHRISHPTNLIIGSLNINSVRHKSSTVNHILSNGYLDIFGLSETKTDQSFPDAKVTISYWRKIGW